MKSTKNISDLVLVRHGQSEWNQKNLFTGWKNPSLTLKGKKEAEKTGENLKGKNIAFDIHYTSGLKRAQLTGEIILSILKQESIKTIKNIALNERNYGDLSGLNKDDARKMLELQSNNEVKIITCMIYKSKDLQLIDISSTIYKFKKFDKDDLEQYIQSGECMGKAGAIMVEGFAKKYIKSVKGYESCAMGLCIEKLIPYISIT
jgi:bisphosphoglycerate-dependent phosphoglycerate mutase family 1